MCNQQTQPEPLEMTFGCIEHSIVHCTSEIVNGGGCQSRHADPAIAHHVYVILFLNKIHLNRDDEKEGDRHHRQRK